MVQIAIYNSMPDNLEFRKSFDFGRLIELAYVVVILCAFSWAFQRERSARNFL